MTTDAEREAFEAWVRDGARFGAGWIFGPFYNGVLMVEVDKLPTPKPEPVADDLVERLLHSTWGSNVADTLQSWTRQREEAAARITELQAEVERLRVHIATIHNKVRHELSAEIEAAAYKAFKDMSGTTVLRPATLNTGESDAG